MDQEEEITFCYKLLKPKIECISCFALALNCDATMLIESHCDEINIYAINEEEIKKIQRIQLEEILRMRIYCMKQSSQFVCGGTNNSIQIWTQQEDNMFHLTQVLQNAHTNWITCLIMNSVEDLLISSATDNSIRFWTKKFEQLQILECHTGPVSCVCLNKSQNQLVSCGEDNQIVISKQEINGFWKVVQIIKVQELVSSVGFFGDDLILFQYQLNGNLNIYEFKEQFEFLRIIDVGVNDLYQKQILAIQEPVLVIQNDMEVIVMSKQMNDFMVQQKIEVFSDDVRCALGNGMLVLWDDGSQQVKFRKYEEYKL